MVLSYEVISIILGIHPKKYINININSSCHVKKIIGVSPIYRYATSYLHTYFVSCINIWRLKVSRCFLNFIQLHTTSYRKIKQLIINRLQDFNK
jgi:hypothetical protein